MIKLRLKTLPMVVWFGVLAPFAAAQTAPAPQPPAPQTPPPKSTAPAAPLSPQTKSALKLAGLVTFVANRCPALKPNYPRFEQAINALGVTKADLDKLDMRGRYLGYAALYNDDAKTSCQRAEAQFGPQGTTLTHIFEPQSAPVLPPH